MTRWLAGWLGGWVAGWLAGWVAGWLGGWAARAPPHPHPLPPTDRNPPNGWHGKCETTRRLSKVMNKLPLWRYSQFGLMSAMDMQANTCQ